MEITIKKIDDFLLKSIDDYDSIFASNCPKYYLKDVVSGKSIDEFVTSTQLCWSQKGLYLYFKSKDAHIWGTFENDDDPIFKEEVVEMFIAKGRETPKRYFEFQFSPKGVRFDAKVHNPTGDRNDVLDVDIDWNCRGLEFFQKIEKLSEGEIYSGIWETLVFLPWKGINIGEVKENDVFRFNLFRIDGYPKQNSFQALCPTMKEPADFHVPAKFAHLILEK